VDRSGRSGLILLAGVALLGAALAIQAILLETVVWTLLLAGAGALLSAWGAVALRAELGEVVRRRRSEIALYTLGVIGVLIALAYLSVLYPFRFDLTQARLYSLSGQTVTMLKRLDRPVHIVFFHDPMMRETVELYELMAEQTKLVTVEFYDPMISPAQARMLGVQFAGTAVMESEGRRLQVNSDSETDIANGILRVSRRATQLVCFLDGHGEADPFSLESHDHMEGTAGHTHGLGAKYVLHERHGMGKARHGLENLNYTVEKVSLVQVGGDVLSRCAVLVVAGPKAALLPTEVAAVRGYLGNGGSAFFMLDPFVRSGLEPVIREYGVVLDDDIVIDEASHFWADPSSPAVSDYNRHQVTRELPLTFFPGVRSLSPTPQRAPGTSVIPIINSSKNSWGQTNRDRVEFTKGRDVPGPNTLMVLALRRPVASGGPPAIPLGPTGGRADAAPRGAQSVPGGVARRSRIAVVGDSDFATNSFFHIMGNGALFLNTVNYLAAQENLIGIQPRTADLPRVNLTNRQMKGTFFLSVILVPALLALVGTAVWWRQR
jgi:gliding motility-associatede transport system auxiliary component